MTDAKEVGVGNPAEEKTTAIGQTNEYARPGVSSSFF